MAIFLWQFYWLLQCLVVALVFRNWILLWTFMAAVPVAGIIAQELYVMVKKANGMARLLSKKKEIEKLVERRKEIVIFISAALTPHL
jgi:hypothetical protein